MALSSCTPWLKVFALHPDLIPGELSLNIFAADLNDVAMRHGLRRNPLFQQLLQALIELAPAGSEERALLESISNHVGGKQVNTPSLFQNI